MINKPINPVGQTSVNTPIHTPVNILYQDDTLLVIQTLAYADVDSIDINSIDINSVDINNIDSLNHPDKDVNQMKMLAEGQPSFGQFNLGMHVKDNPTQVLANRCQLIEALSRLANKPVKQIHWLNQVHGKTVVDMDKGVNSEKQNSSLSFTPFDADAITTTATGDALAIMTADCVPVMLYCQETGRVAGIHAGWQGLAKGIIAETVQLFKQDNQELSTPLKIQAWIGACISGDNYEVSQEVLDKLVDGTIDSFEQYAHLLSSDSVINNSLFSKNQLVSQVTQPHDNPDKAWIDLPALTKLQLNELGVDILTEDIPCSYADPQYYSHRRATHIQQGSTGRMAMLVVKF